MINGAASVAAAAVEVSPAPLTKSCRGSGVSHRVVASLPAPRATVRIGHESRPNTCGRAPTATPFFAGSLPPVPRSWNVSGPGTGAAAGWPGGNSIPGTHPAPPPAGIESVFSSPTPFLRSARSSDPLPAPSALADSPGNPFNRPTRPGTHSQPGTKSGFPSATALPRASALRLTADRPATGMPNTTELCPCGLTTPAPRACNSRPPALGVASSASPMPPRGSVLTIVPAPIASPSAPVSIAGTKVPIPVATTTGATAGGGTSAEGASCPNTCAKSAAGVSPGAAAVGSGRPARSGSEGVAEAEGIMLDDAFHGCISRRSVARGLV